jgi:hypothetical protein
MNYLKAISIKPVLCLLLISFFMLSIFAQSGDETLTNASIIELTQAGLTPSVITQKIRTEHTNFDVSTAALAELKKAGVAPAVMQAMMNARQKDKMSNADPNDPKALHPAGIYYFNKADNTMKQMEEAIYEKDDGFNAKNQFAQGYARDNGKISMDGPSAKFQLTDASPVFYLYTDPKNRTPAFPNTFTPNMLVLASIDVHKKNRSITTGTYDIVNGNKNGVGADKKASFEYEKVGDNAYKIYFTSNIAAGEYGFCVGKSFTKAGSTSTSANKVFDFGIH